jgi:hypothetical protein
VNAPAELAAFGWPVIPLHSPVNGRCSCGDRDCRSVAKHPRTLHGLTGATTDRVTIERWWGRIWPDANVGVRMGEGRLVLLHSLG